jgi:hypothetical protein
MCPERRCGLSVKKTNVLLDEDLVETADAADFRTIAECVPLRLNGEA